MRIVYVTASLPHGSGESFLLPEITALTALGHELLIVPAYPRGPVLHGRCQALADLAVVRSLWSSDVVASALAQLLRTPALEWRALRQIAAARRLKVLFRGLAVLPKGLWLARLAAEWQADHIHAHWATAPATVAMIASQVSGLGWSMTAHRYDIKANELLGAKTRHAGFVRFVSHSGRELARRLGITDDAKTFVLHLGVELPDASAFGPWPAHQSGSPRLLSVARLTAIKGHEHLLKAIAVLRAGGLRAKLLLVGDGERRETLERLAVSEGITEQVRFLGQLRHEEVLALYRYQRFSAYVQPSVELGLGEHEGIPVSLMEAMACGVPVVATATGGIPELVQQGAGLLVPGSEPRALADALAKVIVDQGLAGRLSRGGRRRVEADFDVSKIGSELARRFETAKVPRTWP